MTRKISIDNLDCLCSRREGSDKIAYIFYPMDMLSGWIDQASERYDTSIVVITGMDWQNVFSPWKAPGVPKGTPDFEGQSPEFLALLQQKVIPQVEASLGFDNIPVRTLVGVSMSGLFALWQWMVCDTFRNIASLSGSFWYEGFVEWMKKIPVPAKAGEAYFLLGDQETKSNVKTFNTVGAATQEIISLLRAAGIKTEFQSVPGNHYADAIPRLERAFSALFG